VHADRGHLAAAHLEHALAHAGGAAHHRTAAQTNKHTPQEIKVDKKQQQEQRKENTSGRDKLANNASTTKKPHNNTNNMYDISKSTQHNTKE
jgi:Tfp pilus assembly protein FimT